jgi:cytochrome P450
MFQDGQRLKGAHSMSRPQKYWESMGYIPNHVPPELVKPFDFAGEPGMTKCPFTTTTRLHGKERIFWNPNNPQFGGSWVPTRAEDIRFILNSSELFTVKAQAGFSAMLGESWDMTPLEIDPPQHAKFRSLLNPLLSPKVVSNLTPGMTARAVGLIEAVRDKGECEFMSAFGRAFPVGVFMQLMGLPAQDTDLLLSFEYELLHAPEIERKTTAAGLIRDYLRDLATQRRADPREDLTSFVVSAKVDDRRLTDDEIMGVLYLLFVGGLDTVASSLGFAFRHFALHPEVQRELRAEPGRIERVVDEFVRRFSVVTVHRQCKGDVDIGGVQMKAGDWVTINCALASLDPAEFQDPLELKLSRKPIGHMGFSAGPHFCMGAHLARRELVIAFREWLGRVPTWRLKPSLPVEMHGGIVYGVQRLHLEWNDA